MTGRARTAFIAAALAAVVPAASGQVATARPRPEAQQRATAPQLDSAQLIRDLFVLAADSMEGRRIGTPGGARARTYLLGRLKAIGLAPMTDSFPVHFASVGRTGGDTTRGVNLVGVVRGAKDPDRYIVLSAHYDHVGV
ncbi:MAG: peptidase M28, partial [Gemmatimonadota bacterium]|nr:peptidase M28 [Gemmatimonadota bacterium]